MKTKLFSFMLFFANICSAQHPMCDFLGKDSLFVSFVGDTINIWDLVACGFCSSQFAVSITQSADSIYIVQKDTSYLTATCDCLFNVRTTIRGIPAGTYTAVIYRDWHPKYPYSSQPPLLIGKIQFQYSPQTTAGFSYRSFQSGCLIDAISQKIQLPPSQPALLSNFPNPFNPGTTIRFQTSTTEFVVIKVFDILGREVQTLLSEVKIPGQYSVRFNAPPGLSSGLYCYRMQAGSFIQSKTMLLLR